MGLFNRRQRFLQTLGLGFAGLLVVVLLAVRKTNWEEWAVFWLSLIVFGCALAALINLPKWSGRFVDTDVSGSRNDSGKRGDRRQVLSSCGHQLDCRFARMGERNITTGESGDRGQLIWLGTRP